MKTLTFTNKTEYLTWRAQWKTEYTQLSNNIRALKKGIKEAMRKRQYAGVAQNQLRHLREYATEMLELRKQSKILAQQQYLAAKQASFTASSPSVS
jgi:hypothetical protein